ncbi:MAG: dihydropteroate synthase [Chloroflexi bacterium]|nr:dihydropteroate synthase [Chloroflexota bacterium]
MMVQKNELGERFTMLLVANNITTRDSRIDRALRRMKPEGSRTSAALLLQAIAKECTAAGAHVLDVNLQQHHDDPEIMEFAVKAIQDAVDTRLCLSTNHAGTLEAGLQACSVAPIVNHISLSQYHLEMLSLVAQHEADAILLVVDPANPNDAREMLDRAAVLVGAAKEAGIPDERILIDPGILHVTAEPGSRHLVEVTKFLSALPDAFEQTVRSICWVSNASVGAPKRLRPAIDGAVLAILSGLGLSAACLDVLNRDVMRMVRLISVLKNETIYSQAEFER